MLRMILFCIAFISLLSPAPAQQPQPQCKQVDQLEQTRCQLERAILTNNLSLAETIFQKSTYADPNDGEACDKHTYVQCVARTGNLDALDILFKHGLNPNLPYHQNVGIFVLLLHSSPVYSSEENGARLMRTFSEKGLDLDAQMTFQANKSIKYLILSHCINNLQYRGYDAAIEEMISSESVLNTADSNIKSTLNYLDEIIGSIRGTVRMEGAVAHCEAVRAYAACGGWGCKFPK
jgi:hypothetical protein